MELRDFLTDARSSVKAAASARQTPVSIRCEGRLPPLNGNAPALGVMVTCFLKELIKFTPPGSRIALGARAVERGRGWGKGTWVEVTIASRKARLGERGLERVIKCAEPIRLAEVVTDMHRGELRLTLLCRLLRMRGGWFVIRRASGSVPSFAVVVRGSRPKG